MKPGAMRRDVDGGARDVGADALGEGREPGLRRRVDRLGTPQPAVGRDRRDDDEVPGPLRPGRSPWRPRTGRSPRRSSCARCARLASGFPVPTGRPSPTPALTTTRSSPPSSSRTPGEHRRDGVVVGDVERRGPHRRRTRAVRSSSAARASRRSVRRAARARSCPRAANARAMPSPSPELAPVISVRMAPSDHRVGPDLRGHGITGGRPRSPRPRPASARRTGARPTARRSAGARSTRPDADRPGVQRIDRLRGVDLHRDRRVDRRRGVAGDAAGPGPAWLTPGAWWFTTQPWSITVSRPRSSVQNAVSAAGSATGRLATMRRTGLVLMPREPARCRRSGS